MGVSWSKVRGHTVTRTVQRFNIEARTEKVLEQYKPVPAPKYQADMETRQMVLENEWEKVDQAVKKKDHKHSNRLKEVYVTSEDPEGYDVDNNRRRPDNPNRPLPKETTIVGAMRRSHGFKRHDNQVYKPPKGKITLESVQEMLLQHSKDPKANNAGALAARYDLKVADAEALANHFRIFTYVPRSEIENQEIEKFQRDQADPYRAQEDWEVDAGELTSDYQKVRPTVLDIVEGDKAKIGLADPPKPKLITKASVRPLPPQDSAAKKIGHGPSSTQPTSDKIDDK